MIARLACSRDFQAFRESSDGERKEEERKWKRGGKGLFSPNPHPRHAVFSCSLFFAPSSQSESLEQAIVRLKNAKWKKNQTNKQQQQKKNRLLCRLTNSQPRESFSNLHDDFGENVAKKLMFENEEMIVAVNAIYAIA